MGVHGHTVGHALLLRPQLTQHAAIRAGSVRADSVRLDGLVNGVGDIEPPTIGADVDAVRLRHIVDDAADLSRGVEAVDGLDALLRGSVAQTVGGVGEEDGPRRGQNAVVGTVELAAPVRVRKDGGHAIRRIPHHVTGPMATAQQAAIARVVKGPVGLLAGLHEDPDLALGSEGVDAVGGDVRELE